MTHNTLSEPQLSVQGAALRMVDLPLSVYNSLAQVRGRRASAEPKGQEMGPRFGS